MVTIKDKHLLSLRCHQSWFWAGKHLKRCSSPSPIRKMGENHYTHTQIAAPSGTKTGTTGTLTGSVRDRKRTSPWKTAGRCPPKPPSRDPETPLQAHGRQHHTVVVLPRPYQRHLHRTDNSDIQQCRKMPPWRSAPAVPPVAMRAHGLQLQLAKWISLGKKILRSTYCWILFISSSKPRESNP